MGLILGKIYKGNTAHLAAFPFDASLSLEDSKVFGDSTESNEASTRDLTLTGPMAMFVNVVANEIEDALRDIFAHQFPCPM